MQCQTVATFYQRSPEICWQNVAWEKALRFVGKGTNGKEKYGSEEMGEWPRPFPSLEPRSARFVRRFFPFLPHKGAWS